jgi:phosphonoacetaldehyde hydrolase
MGLAKRIHISQILSTPRVDEKWRSLHGSSPRDADVEEIYQRFLPMQFACLDEYSKVIPGVAETTEKLRRRGLKIGSTTGYTRSMLDQLLESAAREGYTPDCSLSPEDVGCGRPFPFMMYEAAVRLHVYPLAALVKVGDTLADVEEGLNAGAWTVGVAQTGNMIGLSEHDSAALPDGDR